MRGKQRDRSRWSGPLILGETPGLAPSSYVSYSGNESERRDHQKEVRSRRARRHGSDRPASACGVLFPIRRRLLTRRRRRGWSRRLRLRDRGGGRRDHGWSRGRRDRCRSRHGLRSRSGQGLNLHRDRPSSIGGNEQAVHSGLNSLGCSCPHDQALGLPDRAGLIDQCVCQRAVRPHQVDHEVARTVVDKRKGDSTCLKLDWTSGVISRVSERE